MLSLTEIVMFYITCALIALSVRVVFHVCGTLARSKFLSGLNRRLRRFRAFGMGGRRKSMLPLYRPRQPWESLCSSHVFEYPQSDSLIAHVDPVYEPMYCESFDSHKPEQHEFVVGGFHIVVDRPYMNSSKRNSVKETTVCITKFSTEPGTGNIVVVHDAGSCVVENCNTVHIHKRYVNVELDCEKCLGVQVMNAIHCESSNATHMTIEKCFDVEEIHGFVADIDMSTKPGCIEPIVYAATPAFSSHYKEKFNAPSVCIEYNHFTQELVVCCHDMTVKVCNVDSVQLEDVSTCKVKHCNVVKGYPTTYTGLENWSDRMENCQGVIFDSTKSDNRRWTTQIVQGGDNARTLHYVKF